MNPLDMTIDIDPIPFEGCEDFETLPPVTEFGVFNPPTGGMGQFKCLAGTLFSLYLGRGDTVRQLCEEFNNPKSYLFEYRPKSLLRDLEQLYVMGAIDLKGDRIVLRTQVPGPLELLARCATE